MKTAYLLLALVACQVGATAPSTVVCQEACEGYTPSTPMTTTMDCPVGCSIVLSNEGSYFWAGCTSGGSFTVTWRPSGYIGGVGCDYWSGGTWPYYWQSTHYSTTGGSLLYVGG